MSNPPLLWEGHQATYEGSSLISQTPPSRHVFTLDLVGTNIGTVSVVISVFFGGGEAKIKRLQRRCYVCRGGAVAILYRMCNRGLICNTMFLWRLNMRHKSCG